MGSAALPAEIACELTTPTSSLDPATSQSDGTCPLGDIEAAPARTLDPVKVEPWSASGSGGNVALSVRSLENPLRLKEAQNAAVDVRSGSNEGCGTCLNCEDAGFDIEAGRDGEQDGATTALESVDLVKGHCARPVQNPITNYDSSQVKAGVPVKLDRNGSSGERTCRVCYLGQASRPESGPPIELGCDCKEDLAFAHRQCAEAWFKIKGNKTCEICGSTVHNVIGVGDATFMENWNGDARTAAESDAARCWQNHRLFNILLACMVFAFVLPWLFHVGSFFS